MEIKAADVMKLRKMTGAGMMDCKKALIEAEGDFARAQDIIREKGKLVVAKRADRTATEGVVVTKIVYPLLGVRDRLRGSECRIYRFGRGDAGGCRKQRRRRPRRPDGCQERRRPHRRGDGDREIGADG